MKCLTMGTWPGDDTASPIQTNTSLRICLRLGRVRGRTVGCVAYRAFCGPAGLEYQKL